MSNDLLITSSTVVAVHPNVSTLKTSNYTIASSDYLIGIGTLTSSITITLPLSPSTGDQYIIKDVNGSSSNFQIIISGNGNLIDDYSTFNIYQNYSSYSFVYTGSQWSAIMAFVPNVNTPPATSNFTWQNQNGATSTDFGGGIFLYAPTNSGNQNLRFLYQTIPSTPYTITARFMHLGGFINGQSNIYGLAWGDGTKFCSFHVNSDNPDYDLNVAIWDDVLTFNSNLYTDNFTSIANNLEWLRISDDGTNRSASVSRDGINFLEVWSDVNTSFLTPNVVGIIINPFNGDQYTSCVSYKQT